MSRFELPQSKMAEETRQAPAAVAALFRLEWSNLEAVGKCLRGFDPDQPSQLRKITETI